MTIEQVLTLIDHYGLPLIILVMLAVWIRPKLDRVIDNYIGGREKHAEVKQAEFAAVVRMDSELNNILNEMLYFFKADWTMCWQFHNSVYSITGIPYLKISATHEATRQRSLASQYQGMPLSLFADNNALLLKGEIAMVNSKTHGNVAIRNAMKEVGITTTLMCPVKNVHGAPIGVVSLAYINDCELTERQTDALRDFASRIAIVLEQMATIPEAARETVRHGKKQTKGV